MKGIPYFKEEYETKIGRHRFLVEGRLKPQAKFEHQK